MDKKKVATTTCKYCRNFYYQQPFQKGKDEIWRDCSISGREINVSSPPCDAFIPAHYFYCIHRFFRTTTTMCLARRRNVMGFEKWEYCKNCRQFELEIKDFIIFKKQRKKMKIKRRKKPLKTSKIKRRNKVAKETPKKKSKIRRRKKK